MLTTVRPIVAACKVTVLTRSTDLHVPAILVGLETFAEYVSTSGTSLVQNLRRRTHDCSKKEVGGITIAIRWKWFWFQIEMKEKVIYIIKKSCSKGVKSNNKENLHRTKILKKILKSKTEIE